MTENLKPSLGVWDWDDEAGNIRIYAGDKLIADFFDPPDGDVTDAIEWSSNADLVVEAGNTFQQCGLSPRELLEGRRELHAALQVTEQKLAELEHHHGGGDDEIYIESAILAARAALAKHKEV